MRCFCFVLSLSFVLLTQLCLFARDFNELSEEDQRYIQVRHVFVKGHIISCKQIGGVQETCEESNSKIKRQ